MRRRNFVKSAAAFAGFSLSALPLALRAEQSWAAQFAAALNDKPWLYGYRSVDKDAFAGQARLSGKWPHELVGTFYRNGPAQHEVSGYRYHHLFDGDGLLQGYQVGPAGVSHTAKLVQTHKLKAERKAGRSLYPSFASSPPNPAPVSSADSINVANISVLHHHNKLLALWEAGSPWEMDPLTLETKGTYAFSEHTKGVPFSAHPRVEPDGTLWNFGYLSSAKLLVLWHIDRAGKVVKMGKIPVDAITMVHDFVVTANHIVLMIPPLHYEPTASTTNFLDAHQWHPQLPTKVLVIDKNNFENFYWLELPAQWVFHYGNAWEDDHGVIRFDAPRSSDPLVVMNSFRELMRGNVVPASDVLHHHYQLDTRKRHITEAPVFGTHLESEFPTIDPRVSGRRNRLLVMLSRNKLAEQPSHISLNEVSTLQVDSGTRRHYRYPDTQIHEEHLFVPAPGSEPESRGWVVGTALDWQTKQTLMNVFDAQSVDAGPIATATLPYALPLGLHGKFVYG